VGDPPAILVVANAADADEIRTALGDEPLPTGAPVISTGDGGDGTLGVFIERQPEVVVIAATLDAGDARSLLAAMRDAAPPGSYHVILIGDVRGPVRNALDAADFGVDRFVARPLSPKALRFAVGAGVAASRRARAAAAPAVAAAAPVAVMPDAPSARVTRVSGTHRAVMVGEAARTSQRMARVSDRFEAMLDAEIDHHVSDEVVRRTSSGFAIPVEAILAAGGDLDAPVEPASGPVTAPMSVHDVPTRPVGVATPPPDLVKVDLKSTILGVPPITPASRRPRTMPPPPPPGAAMSVTDDDIVEESSPEALPRGIRKSDPPPFGEESGSHELPPGVEAPVLSETAGSFDPTESMPWPVRGTEELAKEDEWDAPPVLPVREPTLIINPERPDVPVPVQVGAGAAIDVTERNQGGAWSAAASMPPVVDEDEAAQSISAVRALDDFAIEDDLDADLGGLSVSRPIATEVPPSGGDFARQLRAKMSLMAERLFRQGSTGDVPAPPAVDVRPPHDFRTEIDFAELDAAAQSGGTEVYDLGGATFAGEDNRMATSPGIGAGLADGTSSEATRGTSEHGEIQRGGADAAALIARMFATEMTGHVTFRRDERGHAVEKIIYFDAGRPVFASSTLPADRMGELLFREGKITAEQHAGCRDLVMESGRRMGEILVDKGYLKRRELLPAVRRHVEDIIYSLFAWDHGEYRVVAGDGAALERIRLSRHPAAMVLEGVRRKLDLPTLERLLGPPGTIVEVADRDKAGTVIAVADLSPDERGALGAMDGSADLGQIARATGAQLVSVYQLAWSLSLLGLATVRRRGGDDDEAPALVGETDLAIDRDRVRARHRLVDEADYFALLGVRREATGFEIKRAYEAARRDFDADAFPPELRAELALELAEIGSVLDEAFRVLRDDGLRGDYLLNLSDYV
jgi:hypothetical protein